MDAEMETKRAQSCQMNLPIVTVELVQVEESREVIRSETSQETMQVLRWRSEDERAGGSDRYKRAQLEGRVVLRRG